MNESNAYHLQEMKGVRSMSPVPAGCCGQWCPKFLYRRGRSEISTENGVAVKHSVLLQGGLVFLQVKVLTGNGVAVKHSVSIQGGFGIPSG